MTCVSIRLYNNTPITILFQDSDGNNIELIRNQMKLFNHPVLLKLIYKQTNKDLTIVDDNDVILYPDDNEFYRLDDKIQYTIVID